MKILINFDKILLVNCGSWFHYYVDSSICLIVNVHNCNGASADFFSLIAYSAVHIVDNIKWFILQAQLNILIVQCFFFFLFTDGWNAFKYKIICNKILCCCKVFYCGKAFHWLLPYLWLKFSIKKKLLHFQLTDSRQGFAKRNCLRKQLHYCVNH